MAAISIVTRPSKRKDGQRPLYVRVSHQRTNRYVSLSLTVKPKDWNAASEQVRRTHPHYASLNRYLADVRAEAEGIVHDLLTSEQALTARRIKARLKTELRSTEPEAVEEEQGFLAYCEQLLATWNGQWTYGTYQAYRTPVRKLRMWHGEDPLPFKDVTPVLCRRFQQHLARDLGNKANTIHKNISTLKRFYGMALKEELIPWGRNPWDALKLRKEAAVKEKLTTEELRRLKAVELEEDSLLADVRRWFFFAFYAGGMRFSDVAELRKKNVREEGGAVRNFYRMGKTKGLHGVLLIEEAVAILAYCGWRQKRASERLFPILEGYDLSSPQSRRRAIGSRNALANKYLRKLAQRAGVKKRVSFHLSRHSTAGFLLEQGYDVRTIQKVLGHASIQITESYLRGFKSGGPDEAVRALQL